jgi:hypothetical protein
MPIQPIIPVPLGVETYPKTQTPGAARRGWSHFKGRPEIPLNVAVDAKKASSS